jgi:hypothetical protein
MVKKKISNKISKKIIGVKDKKTKKIESVSKSKQENSTKKEFNFGGITSISIEPFDVYAG